MYMYKFHLCGLEIELADQLILVFQINSAVVRSSGMLLPVVVERFLHYLR